MTRDRRRRHSNDNFLAKLAEAEKLNPYQPPHPPGPSYAAPPPIPMAPEPAPEPQPPPTAAKKSRQKRLSKEGARVAAEAFWEGDVDASSTIDQEEWKKLVLAKPELTRQMSVTLEEAFARADQDGNGTLELGEFLKTKEARRIAEAAEAAHAAEAETRCSRTARRRRARTRRWRLRRRPRPALPLCLPVRLSVRAANLQCRISHSARTARPPGRSAGRTASIERSGTARIMPLEAARHPVQRPSNPSTLIITISTLLNITTTMAIIGSGGSQSRQHSMNMSHELNLT